jgi:hypothetical protein
VTMSLRQWISRLLAFIGFRDLWQAPLRTFLSFSRWLPSAHAPMISSSDLMRIFPNGLFGMR